MTCMNLENVMLSERNQTQRPRTVWFCLFKSFRTGRSADTEDRCMGARVSFGLMKMLHVHNLKNMLKTTALYTLTW